MSKLQHRDVKKVGQGKIQRVSVAGAGKSWLKVQPHCSSHSILPPNQTLAGTWLKGPCEGSFEVRTQSSAPISVPSPKMLPRPKLANIHGGVKVGASSQLTDPLSSVGRASADDWCSPGSPRVLPRSRGFGSAKLPWQYYQVAPRRPIGSKS